MIAEGKDLMHDAGARLGAHGLGLHPHLGEQLRAADVDKAGVILYAVRAAQPAAGLSDDQDGLFALAGLDGGAESRGTGTDDGDVKHGGSSSCIT